MLAPLPDSPAPLTKSKSWFSSPMSKLRAKGSKEAKVEKIKKMGAFRY
jgi:hypothetical protein